MIKQWVIFVRTGTEENIGPKQLPFGKQRARISDPGRGIVAGQASDVRRGIRGFGLRQNKEPKLMAPGAPRVFVRLEVFLVLSDKIREARK